MSKLSFTWAVIGAGPAGIAAIGKLLDLGIDPKKIAWLDPEFKVGDFGTLWRKVSSNTQVGLFLKFFEASPSFRYAFSPDFELKHINPTHTCLLALAAEPLQWISDHLKTTVHSIQGKVQELKLQDRHWYLKLGDLNLEAKRVILATGAEPKSLAFPGVEELALPLALDPDKLTASCGKDDIIAVFGSSHSAILVLKNLIENCDLKKVYNFYLSPLRYAVYFDDWILFDDTGLKGETALWAKKYLEGNLPAKLERRLASEENIQVALPLCTKAIYATGFQKRLIPVEGMPTLKYNEHTGIIAPGLFGLGIAFPEAKVDRYGTLEHRVGLWKFMDYLNNIMPLWLKYEA